MFVYVVWIWKLLHAHCDISMHITHGEYYVRDNTCGTMLSLLWFQNIRFGQFHANLASRIACFTSKLEIMENPLLEEAITQTFYIPPYRVGYFNRVSVTNRSSEIMYWAAYKVLGKNNYRRQNHTKVGLKLRYILSSKVPETHKHAQFV